MSKRGLNKKQIIFLVCLAVVVIVAILIYSFIGKEEVLLSPGSELIGYWKFEGNFRDSSGNGNNGTCPGSTYCPTLSTEPGSYVSGSRTRSSYNFDGANDYVLFYKSLPKTEGTISVWVKPDRKAVQHIIWSGYSGDGFGGEPELHLSLLDNGKFSFYFGSNSRNGRQYRIDGGSYQAGNWYHVAVVYRNNDFVELYVNGNMVINDTANRNIDTSLWQYYPYTYLGKPRSSIRYFDGVIDDMQVYDWALEPEQVRDLWDNEPVVKASCTQEQRTLFLENGVNSSGVNNICNNFFYRIDKSNVYNCNNEISTDVNNDGIVNAIDVQLVINFALGISPSGISSVCFDVNTDDAVNAVDIQMVINRALGIEELRTASILNIPIPENSECFYHENENLPECLQYYKEECNYYGTQCLKVLACPKFYNPVYDSNGIFYPSACWAEQLNVNDYTYGYSVQLKQFISDLWLTKKRNIEGTLNIGGSLKAPFKVPSPHIGFTYDGSGLVGYNNGVFFRSVLWKNGTELFILDYNIYTDDGIQQSTSSFKLTTQGPVYGITKKSLLVFVMFDNVYPEEVLLDWTRTYVPLMNDYIKKKQILPNPIQYDIIPVVIEPPLGVEKPSQDNLYFTQEEIQKVYDAAINKIGISDYDLFIIAPVFLNGFGGYYGWWNGIEFIKASLTPSEPYSDIDKQKGLNALASFQDMFVTISHEILHALGLPGDHVPMGYGTMYLSFVGQNVDPITGRIRTGPSWCDFFGTSQDYYAVEIPSNLEINIGQEPSWLYKSESSSGNCLGGLYGNSQLKDYDKDGKYEIMYANNLIGKELQGALGWIDIDNDNITELIDVNPYGNYEEFNGEIGDESKLIGPSKFSFIEYQNIGNCKFGKIKLETDLIGLVPLECINFNDDVVNIYSDVNYYWVRVEDSQYGTILLARFP